jgi:tetratricopeptide (TPR) repeat protein
MVIVFTMAWRKGAKPLATKPAEVTISMCGRFVVQDDYFDLPVKILNGLGELHYRITTRDSAAQKFFNQGLRLIYAFNHVEALRAFQEASRRDPLSAMTYWGQALALGPNINDINPKDREAMAMAAITKAKELSKAASAKEAGLIDAMSKRYDGKVHDNRDTLNLAYMHAMESLATSYPNDPETLTLYADAIMNSMPWNYWNHDGTPRNGTMKARTALESTLKKFPKHPGAHHLYIHLLEASAKPRDAYASALFLETAMPKAGHLVHMPSHIYARVGEYDRSNASNEMAIRVDEEFLAGSEDQGFYRIGYYPHNIDFLIYGSMMSGRYAASFRDATKLSYHMKSMEGIMPAFYDFFSLVPLITHVRFGGWNEILALPPPDPRYYHTQSVHHMARGLAFLRKGLMSNAETELRQLDSISRLDTLKSIYAVYASAYQIANIAHHLLRGEVLLRKQKTEEGLNALRQAVAAEDTMRYNEPPDWRLPSRHYLGAALLDAGQYAEAEKVYETELKRNPGNGWSLQGLLQCQKKLGRKKEAADTQLRFDKVWKQSDAKITSSRF